jgi:hypothetical protein
MTLLKAKRRLNKVLRVLHLKDQIKPRAVKKSRKSSPSVEASSPSVSTVA